MKMHKDLSDEFKRTVPVTVKIAPAIENSGTPAPAALRLKYIIDTVIATTTSIDHSAIADSEYADEAGGLSGRPLKDRPMKLFPCSSRDFRAKSLSLMLGGFPVLKMPGSDCLPGPRWCRSTAALFMIERGR